MTNNFIPPEYGAPVPLICLKCKNNFVGPNPIGYLRLEDVFKKIKRAKCPKCGSHRVIRDPWILY